MARMTLDRGRLLEQFAERLAGIGAEHADVAAAVLAARGAERLTAPEFARRHGVALAELERAETGELALTQLSPALRSLVGLPSPNDKPTVVRGRVKR